MTVLPFPTQPVPAPPALDALALVRDYLARVHPARRHGATDCGEHLSADAALPDGDHLLAWLWERGFQVVPLPAAAAPVSYLTGTNQIARTKYWIDSVRMVRWWWGHREEFHI